MRPVIYTWSHRVLPSQECLPSMTCLSGVAHSPVASQINVCRRFLPCSWFTRINLSLAHWTEVVYMASLLMRQVLMEWMIKMSHPWFTIYIWHTTSVYSDYYLKGVTLIISTMIALRTRLTPAGRNFSVQHYFSEREKEGTWKNYLRMIQKK